AAVTNGDNSNILVARIARESFGIERVVARIYDPRRAVIYQRLSIPTVATVSWTTDQVLRRLLPGEQPHDWIDPSARVSLVERVLPSSGAATKAANGSSPTRARCRHSRRPGSSAATSWSPPPAMTRTTS